uniref:Serine dehydrogenase proteinase n=1 Tax=Candidatus Kentrum sp. FM TaxID=2126340 RepID=A0A450SI99_9GAMM|nr:MAG: Serine dehydrogenase proteinase [Candidatus Kentron sp. FM]VFJ56362.1 MAG: Serine dehydrogenase proteinase [Candidatus Kentron sp. FM]VFK11183.1 MAG: Serine dehydrogenase proteinase [Candidatus Kentron sp. FM]
MSAVNDHVIGISSVHLKEIGKLLDADALVIFSPIVSGLDTQVKQNIESLDSKRSNRLVVVLDTYGGVIEVVERIVNTIRKHYNEMDVIIPDHAMSAGTIFALSADNIYMNYFSYLGPIDPQVVQVDGRLSPALGYLEQFNRLSEESKNRELTQPEAILLEKLDLADLYRYDQAREHSVELIEDWLSKYKFKSWTKTETKGSVVTGRKKKSRAKAIAKQLNNTKRWHAHGRGINMFVMREELKLKIEDFDENDKLSSQIRSLYDLVTDYMGKTGLHMHIDIQGLKNE